MCVYMCVCEFACHTHFTEIYAAFAWQNCENVKKKSISPQQQKIIMKSKIKTRKAVNYGCTKAIKPFKDAFL